MYKYKEIVCLEDEQLFIFKFINTNDEYDENTHYTITYKGHYISARNLKEVYDIAIEVFEILNIQSKIGDM